MRDQNIHEYNHMYNHISCTKATILLAGRYFSLWSAMKCKVKVANMKLQAKFNYSRAHFDWNVRRDYLRRYISGLKLSNKAKFFTFLIYMINIAINIVYNASLICNKYFVTLVWMLKCGKLCLAWSMPSMVIDKYFSRVYFTFSPCL